jgi:hypothetical protein
VLECLVSAGMAANRDGMMIELLCKGASECQSSSSKPWINVLFIRAADKGGSFCIVCKHSVPLT